MATPRMIDRAGHVLTIEIKRTTTPRVTRSMRSAFGDLDLSEAVVVHAGRDSYRLAHGIRAVSARRLDADLGI